MTFGFKNAPSHFQRSMNLMLNDLLDKCVLVYMDDILIYSRSKQDHVEHVKQVFQRLSDQNWHVKSKKCALFLDKVEFLGHVITKDGVSVADVKVSAVHDWPIPKTVRDVQGFLGLANFYQ